MDAALLPDTLTLFHQEPSGVTYRIPALLYIPPTRTVLAFAEKRSTPEDVDAEHLVMRQGLMTEDSIEWKSVVPLKMAELPGYRTMNPCPVYERNSKTVFLFFICVRQKCTESHQILFGKNAAKLCFVTSEDSGATWSPLIDLTEKVIGQDIVRWATFAVGPGHGIQLQCGRLIIPAYVYIIHRRCFCPCPCCTKPHSLIFYSDDGGRSWHKGGMIRKQVTGECEVAELMCNDGTCILYCSARTKSGSRAEAISKDSGRDFETLYQCKTLCEPPHGCQGSVVSFVPPEEYQLEGNSLRGEEESLEKEHLFSNISQSWLIYSHPTSKKKRVDLGVYLNKSPMIPASWNHPWIINKGPSGYSDLVAFEGCNTFGCLFECGTHSECQEIVFRKFTMEELMRNMLESDVCSKALAH